MILPFLAVKDLESSLKFYTEKLGFTSTPLMGPDGKLRTAFVQYGKSVQIGLGREQDMAPVTVGGGGVNIMLYPDDFDIDAYYQQVKSKGVTIGYEINTEYWGDRIFALNDPDGYYLTFAKTIKQISMEEAQALLAKQGIQ